MIPKIIHYCWFGKGEQPEIVRACIASWKKFCPDYKFILWNEENFDVNSTVFTRIAYENKKWAFVSDYVRLFALQQYGGVYLDVDVEIVKDFSSFLLTEKYLSSFQEGGFLSTCFFACQPNHPFVNALLEHYQNKKWIQDNYMIMNPIIFTKIALERFNLDNSKNVFINDLFSIYPSIFFTPPRKSIFGKGMKRFKKNKYHLSKNNTYVIHHELGSWAKKNVLYKIIVGSMRCLLPYQIYDNIKKIRAKKLIDDYEL